MSKYSITVKQTGAHATSVVGDNAQLIANFSTSSSADDFMKLLASIRKEIDVMGIPADVKDEAALHVDHAIIQAKKESPDKSKLAEYLKKAADIVKDSSTLAIGVSQFWTLIRKAIEWASCGL